MALNKMSDPIPYDWIQAKWNEAVKGRLGKTIRVLTSDRRAKIALRWQEWVGAGLDPREVYQTILLTMRHDRFHSDLKMMRGEQHQTWHPTIDYAMRSPAKAMSLYEAGCEIRERFERKDAPKGVGTRVIHSTEAVARDNAGYDNAYRAIYAALTVDKRADLAKRAHDAVPAILKRGVAYCIEHPRTWHWIKVKSLMDAEGLAAKP